MADQVEHSPDIESPEEGGPEAGAKADAGANGLYDLSSTPEELRPWAEDLVAQVSKNANQKFMEHAEYRKGWAPYEELGIRDMDPAELQELIDFRTNVLGDPETLQQWLGAVAAETGFTPELTQEQWIEIGDQQGFFDPEDGGENPAGQQPDQQSLMDTITSVLEQRLAPLENFLAEQQTEQTVGQIRQQLEQQLDSLEEEHGEYDRDAVVRLAHAFDAEGSEDPIADAFQEYQRLRGTSQADLLDAKGDQPASALGTGQADTAPEQFDRLDDPKLKDAVRRRLAASR